MPEIILMVDDDIDTYEYIAEYWLKNSDYTLITATTLDAGWKLYTENKESIVGIIMDGCIASNLDAPDTLPLIQSIRTDGFTGPMVAASLDPSFCKLMVEAGCTMLAEDKTNAAFHLLELLRKEDTHG